MVGIFRVEILKFRSPSVISFQVYYLVHVDPLISSPIDRDLSGFLGFADFISVEKDCNLLFLVFRCVL